MKSFSLLCLICFAISCAGSKKIVTSNENSTSTDKENSKNLESIIETPSDTFSIKDSLNITPTKEDVKNDEVLKDKITELKTKFLNRPNQTWNELLDLYVSEEGKVDYKSFSKEHQKLLDYIHNLSFIRSDDTFESLSKNEKLAYWINTYNALTIDLIIRHYPLKSIKDIKDPWNQRLWKLGDKWYNLNEIEHQILRKMNEPRIHFAIVCGSYSCPKLKNEAYTSENLDEQLTDATKTFLADDKRNNISSNNLELSKIFQWFTKDFKQDGSLIDFLKKYSDIKISDKAKKRFKDYNWVLND